MKSRRIRFRNWVEVKVEDLHQWMKFVTLSEKERVSYHWTDCGPEEEGRKWLFRGQVDAEWPITSTLERTTLFKRFSSEDYRKKVERHYIDEFRRRSHGILAERSLTPFDLVAMMQHYGAPTRLIDFTYSAYVALYFAVNGENAQKGDERDFAVWAICLDELHEHPEFPAVVDAKVEPKAASDNSCICEYRVYDNTTEDVFSEESFGSPRSRVYFAYPKFGSVRSNAQSGVFLLQSSLQRSFMDDLTGCMNCKPEKARLNDLCHENVFMDQRLDLVLYSRVIKYVFAKSLRQEASLALRSMNILPHTLFPDLSGIARTISMSANEKIDDYSRFGE